MTAADPPAGIILAASNPAMIPRYVAAAPGAAGPILRGRAPGPVSRPPASDVLIVHLRTSGAGPRFVALDTGSRAAGYAPALGGRARVRPEDAPGVLLALNAGPGPAPRWAVVLLAWYQRQWASDRIKRNMKAKKAR